ncbi:MAG TPA: hypothetical protein PKV98_08785 [Burkholderiaceae bacterium]|nr:hypothetical protein [Burkholderiaceae bacterium]
MCVTGPPSWSGSLIPSAVQAFPGTCQLHRAAVLGVQGELDRVTAEVRTAADLLESDWALRERRGHLLCLVVYAAVAAGEIERACAALRTLSTVPQMLATDALKAMHCGAEAKVALADREFTLAAQKLRQAVRHWREAGLRVGEAETRPRLAKCLLQDDDAAGAELEPNAVESNFASVVSAHRARLDALRNALRDGPRVRRASR